MAENIIPLEGQERKTRVECGRQLFEERGTEIVHLEAATWLVPSCTGATNYLVNLDAETCECADFEHRGQLCKHRVAATIARSKSVRCSCCGEWVLGRFVSEVTEDDGLLSWFVGDRLCADCIREGYWC